MTFPFQTKENKNNFDPLSTINIITKKSVFISLIMIVILIIFLRLLKYFSNKRSVSYGVCFEWRNSYSNNKMFKYFLIFSLVCQNKHTVYGDSRGREKYNIDTLLALLISLHKKVSFVITFVLGMQTLHRDL